MPIPCSHENCASHLCFAARDQGVTLATEAEFETWWSNLGADRRSVVRSHFFTRRNSSFDRYVHHVVSRVMAAAHLRLARMLSSDAAVSGMEEAHRSALIDWLERRTGVRRCEGCGEPLDRSGRCDNGCWRCPGCDRMRSDSRCGHCGQCEGCCECVTCQRCGALANEDGAFDCACGNELRSYDPQLKFHDGQPNPHFPRHVGVEIEFGYDANKSAKQLNAALVKWHAHCHGDGSVEVSDKRSREIATAPAKGTDFVDQVVEICDGLKLVRASVNHTCGLHVHVNAKDLTNAQILALVRLYRKIELGLYEVVSPSRMVNHYTKPWAHTLEWNGVLDNDLSIQARSDRLDASLYGSLDEARRYKRQDAGKHNCRYHGLNLNALPLYGTVEFRIHQGTVNPEKILAWAATCSAIVHYAATHDEAQIEQLRGSPFEILKKVVRFKRVVKWLELRRAHFALQRAEMIGLAKSKTMPDQELSEDMNAARVVND